jgi:hypothetical protein
MRRCRGDAAEAAGLHEAGISRGFRERRKRKRVLLVFYLAVRCTYMED